jgi:hypothetical protein
MVRTADESQYVWYDETHEADDTGDGDGRSHAEGNVHDDPPLQAFDFDAEMAGLLFPE